MFDATSACDSRRVRMPTCALMHTAAHVPTAFCSPVLQMATEYRPCTSARPTGSSGAHCSSSLQRVERCSSPSPSCCGIGSHAAFAVTAFLLLNAQLHEQTLEHVLCSCCACELCKQWEW